MAPKLTKNSAAVKLLLAKFRNGIINENHTPAEVWRSEAVFQQYKLPTFRTRFHRVKKQVEAERNLREVEEKDHGENLNRRISGLQEVPKTRRLIEEAAEDSDEEDQSEVQGDTFNELVTDLHSFKPLHLVSEWEEEYTRTKRISVAIGLPSGVGTGEFSVRVIDSGTAIELIVRWPDALLNMKLPHKIWLSAVNQDDRIESYHPKISGFEQALRKHRQLATDSVESVARIPLPFPVETHIAGKSNIAWRESSLRVVYVDLKGAIEGYAVGKDYDDFVLA